MFIKESPRYLYFTNNQLDAIQSLHWLRGDDADCSREIRELEDTFRQSSSTDEVTWKEMIMKQQYRTPLILSLALMFFQQFSGINAIMFYLDDIFQVNISIIKIDVNISNRLQVTKQILNYIQLLY